MNIKRMAKGALVGVAGLIIVWVLVQSVQGWRERERERREAVKQEELARQREVEARALTRTGNTESIAALQSGSVPQWTWMEARLRLAAERGKSEIAQSGAQNYDLCPELKPIEEKPAPKDEFDRRDREAERDRVLSGCLEKIKGRVAKFPSIYFTNCNIKEKPEYSFEKGRFAFTMADCRLVDKKTWYVGTGWPDLVLDGAGTGGVVDDRSVVLSMDEAHARAFKNRVLLPVRLQLAFEIGSYGTTSLRKPASDPMERAFFGNEGKPLEGFSGRPIAFRLVAGRDALIDWTPYGKDAQGSEAAAQIHFEQTVTHGAETGGNVSDLSPDERDDLRKELAGMRAKNRWPGNQRVRYVKVCMKQKTQVAKLNQRVCDCLLEVIMDRYPTFGDFAKELVDHGGAPDEQVAQMTGLCLSAYGS